MRSNPQTVEVREIRTSARPDYGADHANPEIYGLQLEWQSENLTRSDAKLKISRRMNLFPYGVGKNLVDAPMAGHRIQSGEVWRNHANAEMGAPTLAPAGMTVMALAIVYHLDGRIRERRLDACL